MQTSSKAGSGGQVDNNSAKKYLAEFMTIASSGIVRGWKIASQLEHMDMRIVGRETRSGSHSSFLFQFTPLHD
jgi:hypothetical protein